MGSVWISYRRSVQVMIILLTALSTHSLWASCSFENNTRSALLVFNLPAITVPQDAAAGTVLHTEQASAATVKVSCNAKGPILQGYKALSVADYQSGNPLEGVYASNVPGIGLRATWVNSGSASFASGSYIMPWHMASTLVSSEAGTYALDFQALIQIVVTGPVASGTLNTDKLVAEWRYDDLVVAELLFTTTTVEVKASTCDLVEKNIVVPLNTISAENFVNDVSPIVSTDDFRIQLNDCASGLNIDIKFSSSGGTGIINGNTLKIATSDSAAKGVGIQLLAFSSKPITFNQVYYFNKTVAGQTIVIPLKARYVKTGPIAPGEVNALATFEINYR